MKSSASGNQLFKLKAFRICILSYCCRILIRVLPTSTVGSQAQHR